MAWYIVDGDLPYENEFIDNAFSESYTIDETPVLFWQIIDGAIPFRPSGYPQMYTVNDVPDSFWRIIDGDDPFRLTFPPMPKPPKWTKNYKGKHSKVIIPIYKQTIPVGKILRGDDSPADPQSG